MVLLLRRVLIPLVCICGIMVQNCEMADIHPVEVSISQSPEVVFNAQVKFVQLVHLLLQSSFTFFHVVGNYDDDD